MGDLRRVENLIPLTVLSLGIINPHPSEAFGYRAVLVVYFMLLLTFLGITLNLAYSKFPKADPILSNLIIAFALTHTFSLISALGFGRKIFGNEHMFIPYFYLAYFLGLFANFKVLSRWIPTLFVFSVFFIFSEVLVDMFKEYNPTFRFGYRNAFFTPTILGISLYLISDERNLYKRLLYLLSILLSVAVIILGGNRTNYIVVFATLFLLIFYRWYKGESVLKQSSVILISFTITIALGLLFGYLMFGKAFLLYVFSRFSTLLSPHETLTDPSAQIRAYDFSLALSRFSLSPAFGRAEMDILTRWIEGSALFFVDNSFINVLWKMGLFGFGVYILMLSYSLYIVIRGVLMKYDLAFFTLLLFISLLILSLTTSSLIYYIHIAVLMVCVGVISRKLSEVPN
ncbi:MAG: hypothetical protein RQ967_01915 [Candidatus Caldipriscus sp.]|nr:hypothetical protein [Candidatus Caldipriscus sp.]